MLTRNTLYLYNKIVIEYKTGRRGKVRSFPSEGIRGTQVGMALLFLCLINGVKEHGAAHGPCWNELEKPDAPVYRGQTAAISEQSPRQTGGDNQQQYEKG